MTTLLREGMLDGRSIALGGSPQAGLRDALGELGASIVQANDSTAQVLVHDACECLRREGLSAALADTWSNVATVANGSLIPAGRGGKVVLIAPRPDTGEHAEAARDALENLARTLSVEWARYGITVTAIAPGAQTSESETRTLVCFLVSEAGDYFSGCRFDLR